MPSFLTGSVRLAACGVRPEALFNRIRRTVPLGFFRKTADDACEMTVDDASLSTVQTQVAALGGRTRILARRGLPWMLVRFLHRPGLLVGTLLSLALIFGTRTLIWEMRIEGGEGIPQSELLAVLHDVGIGEGERQQKALLDDAVLETLIADGRIAWLSVNYDGTVAHVRLDKRITPPPDESKCDYITAARDGVLMRLDVLGGGAEAKNGDAVTRGQLLISSFKPSREAGTLYDPARGFAWALTEHAVSVVLPRYMSKRVYADTPQQTSTLLLLGKEVPLTFFARLPEAPYERTTRTERVMLFDRIPMPFRVKSVTYTPYHLESLPLTAEDAHSLADEALARRIASFPGGTQILSQTVSFAETDDDFTFTYTLECLENIAEQHGDGKSAP